MPLLGSSWLRLTPLLNLKSNSKTQDTSMPLLASPTFQIRNLKIQVQTFSSKQLLPRPHTRSHNLKIEVQTFSSKQLPFEAAGFTSILSFNLQSPSSKLLFEAAPASLPLQDSERELLRPPRPLSYFRPISAYPQQLKLSFGDFPSPKTNTSQA